MINYSWLDKQLHAITLSTKLVKEVTFDIAKLSLKKILDVQLNRHVFIAGLARSGSTILLQTLYDSHQFGSLTYAQMPFIMAPTFTLLNRQNLDKRERAHGDGLLINNQSPEAFEDVFWQTFEPNVRDRIELKQTDSFSKDLTNDFYAYINLVLNRSDKYRYLSKNNNNICRLNSLISIFPNAMVMIPFRDPLNHAYSLFKQHQRFSSIQKQNPFVLKYMNWLGHREFGLGHIPFVSGEMPLEYSDKNTLNYWLEQWLLVYQFLLDSIQLTDQIMWINYDTLCTDVSIWNGICQRLNISVSSSFKHHALSITESIDPMLVDRCQRVWMQCCDQSFESLNQHAN